MYTIKSKLFFALFMTFITIAMIIFIFTNRYEGMMEKYGDLTNNPVLIEEVLFLTDDIHSSMVKLYTSYDPKTEVLIVSKQEELSNLMFLLDQYIVEDNSLFIYRRLKNSVANFNKYIDTVINAMNEKNIVIANENRELSTISNDAINTIAQELISTELGHLQTLRVSLDQELKSTKVLLYILASIGLVLLFIALLKMNRNIIKNMNNIVYIFREIGRGNLYPKIKMLRTRDEFQYLVTETIHMQESIAKLTKENETSKNAIVSAIGSLAEMRDSETGEHIQRVQGYIGVICVYLINNSIYSKFLDQRLIDTLIQVSPLHDIGKVGIPDNILKKPGRLTTEEFGIMQQHVNYGQKVIQDARASYGAEDSYYLDVAEKIILHHHEKWDGTGYPNKLKESAISLEGRIMALADVYDALTTPRIYKEAFSHEKAKNIICESKGKHFDPEIVNAFFACEQDFERISNNAVGIV